MTQALLTGVSGMLAQQTKLDIVANNLANMNTTAYKAQRILFADLLYSTFKAASSGDALTSGTNALQKGFGVNVATTDRNFSQGVLSSTGQTFDFALDGDGFFVVDQAGTPHFTRAGAFSLDRNGFLVDSATGGRVQRIGTTGEGDADNPAFQVEGNSAIRVPLGIGIPGRATSNVSMSGNLPATATAAAAEILSSAAPYRSNGNPATAATLLNDLDSNVNPYVLGDQIRLTGFAVSGAALDATLNVTPATSIGDLINFLNANLVGSQASLDSEGNLRVIADAVGPSSQRIDLIDVPTNAGGIRFNEHTFVEEVEGKDNDTVETTLQLFDLRGEAHNVNVTFSKVDKNSWDAEFDLIDNDGVFFDNVVRRIEFAENGAFLGAFGTGTEGGSIEVRFDQMNFSQIIDLQFDQLTHLANRFTTSVNQNGFPPGNLVNVAANVNGVLEGIASNGRRLPIAQMAIATFFNTLGLEAVGQNYFSESTNSGVPRIGEANAGSAGAVRGGQLESSNVDVALEFTQLIVAQRGFSANARTITVANEVLQELTSILR